MKVHIESKGEAFDTKITDLETGKPVGLVQKVTWEVDVNNQIPRCTLEILKPQFNTKVDAKVLEVSQSTTSSLTKELTDQLRSLAEDWPDNRYTELSREDLRLISKIIDLVYVNSKE